MFHAASYLIMKHAVGRCHMQIITVIPESRLD